LGTNFKKTLHSGLVAFASVAGFLLLSVLSWIAAEEYRKSSEPADCHLVRGATDQFTADRKVSPPSLQELVRSGYLSEVRADVPALESCIPTREDSPPTGKSERMALVFQPAAIPFPSFSERP
jgi:hypothetical protein